MIENHRWLQQSGGRPNIAVTKGKTPWPRLASALSMAALKRCALPLVWYGKTSGNVL